jgi:phosphoenolpyruvate-protein phosphotransferase
MANVEFYHELEEASAVGAHGIGLFRTEGIFLGREGLPDEEEQYQVYRKFSERLGDLPLILRTIDTGGDKVISELEGFEELNPFLGWRGIRFCLAEPEIFKTQLRAVLRANVNKNIKILIPMISCLREIEQTKILIEEAKGELRQRGSDFHPHIEIGIMIETPSAVIMLDLFASQVDFLSIGTNDLTQYTLAVDRTNSKISNLFSDMHPAVLRLMQKTLQTTSQKRIDISICGEMAGNPQAIPILLGLGLRTLSLNPYAIPKIKKIIRSLSIVACEQLVKELLTLPTAIDVELKAGEFFQTNVPASEILK